MTIEENISIMQAFADVKEIEFNKGLEQNTLPTPGIDYLIKRQQKKIVPYESDEEFLDAMKEHGPALKIGCFYYIPYCIRDGIIIIDTSFDEYSFNMLLESSWQDGHVCGKEVEG